MLSKLFSFIVLFSLLTTQSFASSQNGLAAAFEELNYSLSTEWDKKDKTFYVEQMKKFTATLRDLQAQGLTNSELMSFIKSQLKDQRTAKELDTVFTLVSLNQMSFEESTKYMADVMNKTRNAGASWNGEVLLYVGLGLVIVGALAIGGGGGSSTSRSTGCYNTTYACSPRCYYDSYYGYTCYDDCYYTCY